MLQMDDSIWYNHAKALECRMLWFREEETGTSGPFSSCIFQNLHGNFQGGPGGCFFWDRPDGSVTVKTRLHIDPCVWLITGFEEQALSLEVDVGAGE